MKFRLSIFCLTFFYVTLLPLYAMQNQTSPAPGNSQLESDSAALLAAFNAYGTTTNQSQSPHIVESQHTMADHVSSVQQNIPRPQQPSTNPPITANAPKIDHLSPSQRKIESANLLAAFNAYGTTTNQSQRPHIFEAQPPMADHASSAQHNIPKPQQPSTNPTITVDAPETSEHAEIISSIMLSTQNMRVTTEQSHAILKHISEAFFIINGRLGELLVPHNTGTPDTGLIHKIRTLESNLSVANNSFQAEHGTQLGEITTHMNEFMNILGLLHPEQSSETTHNHLAQAIQAIPSYNLEISKLNNSIQENINILEQLRNRGTRYHLGRGKQLESNDLNLTREIIKFFTLIQLELRKIQENIDRSRQEFDSLKKVLYQNWTAIDDITNDLLRAKSHQENYSTWRAPFNWLHNAFSSTSIFDPTTEKLSHELANLRKNIEGSATTFNAIINRLKRAEQQHRSIKSDLKMLFAILDINTAEAQREPFNIEYFDSIEKRFVTSIILGEIRTQIILNVLPHLAGKKILDQDTALGSTLLKIIKGSINVLSIEGAVAKSIPIEIVPGYPPSKICSELDHLAQELSLPIQDLLKKMYPDVTNNAQKGSAAATQEQLFPEVRRFLDELLPQLGSIIMQDARAEQGEFDELIQHPGNLNDWFTNKVLQTEDRGCILYDMLCQTRLRLGRSAPVVRQLLKNCPTVEYYFNTYVKKLADPNWSIVEWGDFLLRVSKWLPLCVPVQGIRLAEWFVAKASPELVRTRQQVQADVSTALPQEQPTSWFKRTIQGAVGIARSGAQHLGHVVATGTRIVAGPIVHQTRIAQFLNNAGTITSGAWNSSLDFLYKKFFYRDEANNWRQNSDRPENRLGLKFLLMRVLYNAIAKCGARQSLTDLEKGLIDHEPLSEDIEKLIGRIKRYRLYPVVEPITAFMAENSPLVRHCARQFLNINQVDPIDLREEIPATSPQLDHEQRRIISRSVTDQELRRFLEEGYKGFCSVRTSRS